MQRPLASQHGAGMQAKNPAMCPTQRPGTAARPPAPPGASGPARQRRSRVRPPRSFTNALDVPDLMPGWLLPSWVQPGGEEGARPRDAVRRKRLEQLRELLAAASSEPALSLGTGDDAAAAGGSGSAATSPVDDAGSGSASSSPTSGGTLDVAHSASNAVPFCTGGDRGQGAGSAAPGSTCRAEQAWQVLPWLYTAAGRLDFAAMESVASQLALSGLQLLDVTRYASAATAANGHWHAGLPANIRWAGAAPIPSPAVAAAAALRRMELRRGGALGKLPEVEGKAVVLAYHPQHRQLAAETLALYLHAYLGLGGQEAVQAAGNAVGASPLESTLRESLEELALLADGWYRRVTLAWPYPGGHVEIVGEAVCGWEERAPMFFDVKQKRWRLQIWGLAPGTHRFKYVVDGCWVIDLAAHTEADSRGNINNVVQVRERGVRPAQREAGDGPAAVGTGAAVTAGSSEGSRGGGSTPAPVPIVGGPAGTVGASGISPILITSPPEVPVEPCPGEGDPQQQEEEEEEEEEEVGSSATRLQRVPRPWRDDAELERMARFGAAVLAFHTRLGVQLRHVLH